MIKIIIYFIYIYIILISFKNLFYNLILYYNNFSYFLNIKGGKLVSLQSISCCTIDQEPLI